MTEPENNPAASTEPESVSVPTPAPTDSTPSGDAITDADPTNVKPNLLFRLVIVFSAAFLITILLLLATTFSASRSPVKQILDLYGLHLIGLELAAMLLCGFFAMLVDRRQTLAARDAVIAKALRQHEEPQRDTDQHG